MKVAVVNKKESVIYRGAVYKCGDEIDMDSAIAEGLIERGYVSAIEEDVAEEIEGTLDAEQLEEMSYQDLKRLAKEMGIDASGKKDELIEKICAVEVSVDEEAVEHENEESPNTAMPE